jgi:hypothetical protein
MKQQSAVPRDARNEKFMKAACLVFALERAAFSKGTALSEKNLANFMPEPMKEACGRIQIDGSDVKRIFDDSFPRCSTHSTT